MLLIIDHHSGAREEQALRGMFEARKRVFIDLLRWDLPVLDGRYEIDQFDDEHATYLIVQSGDGSHLGSARLLPSTRPGILSSLFPDLCDGPLPIGHDIQEITRFCLSPAISARDRRGVRNMLVSGLADYGLTAGLRSYTGVAEMAWLQQILAFGWDCMPLGLPRRHGRCQLGALRIDLDVETLTKLDRAGTFVRPRYVSRPTLAA